jgi:GMP synthase-like glutamine amidotransferase
MEDKSVLTEEQAQVFDVEDMKNTTEYKSLDHINLFLYSRNKTNKPLFILYRPADSQGFKHFSEELIKHDPNILFSVTREFILQTAGLLSNKNLKYFLAENASPLNIDELVLDENFKAPVRAQKNFNPDAFNDFWNFLTESPYIFQDHSKSVTYFVELPMLNFEILKEVAQKKGLDLEMKYFTLEEIMDRENQEINMNVRQCLENPKLWIYLNKFIVNCEPLEIKEHYAMIFCCPQTKVDLAKAIVYQPFKRHGEHWRNYKAYEGDLPTDEDLKKLKGIIIPGSGMSAYDMNVPWYNELFECIRKIQNEYKHINLLGLCFGSQVIAQALGGKTAKMERGLYRGADTLNIRPEFFEIDYLKDLGLDSTKPLVIGEAHQDHIVELPSEAICYASSKTAEVEVYTIGSNVLAFQGHPEFNEAWTAGANYRNIKGNLKAEEYDGYAEEYIKNTIPDAITQDELVRICNKFLKKN